jgi:alkanesulfonate monooxygenase SsuD/methylene tetrahydromethanopterin reductase-like flavin-dependent oxidoreductase (luciferase family)
MMLPAVMWCEAARSRPSCSTALHTRAYFRNMFENSARRRYGLLLFSDSFGVDVGSSAVLDWSLEYAREAERSGWDEVWTTEHHFSRHAQTSSAIAMAAFLLGSCGLPVGTAVCALPNHHPVALAEQAALLRHVSGDRFTLGVGRGQPLVDLEILGSGLAGYQDISEAVALLDEALRTGRVQGSSERYRFEEVEIVPTPPPTRAPFALSAASSGSARLAGRHGVPMLLSPFVALEQKKVLLDEHATAAAENGHQVAADQHIDSAYFAVADDGRAARDTLTAALGDSMFRTARDARPLIDRPKPTPQQAHDAAMQMSDRYIAGAPDDCRARLDERFETLGVGRILLMPEAGMPDATLRTIRMAGAEVFLRPC